MTDLPSYVLEPTFAAPRALVWRTWTDPQLLSRRYGASEAEIACFAAAKDNMSKGWGAGMKLLEELLAELKAAS